MLKTVLIVLGMAGLLSAGPTLAHARLQSSIPTDNAQLPAAPKALSLTFSETAQLAMLKLLLDGKEIPLSFDKNAQPATGFSLPLPTLAPGTYTVQWTAVAADDGHITKGAFKFMIAG